MISSVRLFTFAVSTGSLRKSGDVTISCASIEIALHFASPSLSSRRRSLRIRGLLPRLTRLIASKSVRRSNQIPSPGPPRTDGNFNFLLKLLRTRMDTTGFGTLSRFLNRQLLNGAVRVRMRTGKQGLGLGTDDRTRLSTTLGMTRRFVNS